MTTSERFALWATRRYAQYANGKPRWVATLEVLMVPAWPSRSRVVWTQRCFLGSPPEVGSVLRRRPWWIL